MEKEFKATSIENFEKLKEDKKYFSIVPKKIVEQFLQYEDEITIKEIEDPTTLITNLKIDQPNKIRGVLRKIEVIKENLNKYAKEGIENPDNCTIENLRQELIKIKEIFGDKWEKEYLYSVDKYFEIRKFLDLERLFQKEIKAGIFDRECLDLIIKKNVYLLVDHLGKNIVRLEKVFFDKLIILLRQEGLIKKDMSLFLSVLVSSLGRLYGQVYVDFSSINSKVVYENLDITSKGVFGFKSLNCKKFTASEGVITIKDSVIDRIEFLSEKLEKVRIENVLTRIKPVFKVRKSRISIKNLKTYYDMDAEHKRHIREAIFSSAATTNSSVLFPTLNVSSILTYSND